jgi:bifunctional DNA-binding transcriptional regulator/antitoxin component of YhaV-PrlF toxin-antitoxin module
MLSSQSVPQRRMDQVVAGLTTKSAKIRALAAEGYERADIARYLGIRYQHVRNVLTQPTPKNASEAASKETLGRIAVTLTPEGRVLIPAAYRQVLGFKEGEELFLEIEGDGLRLENRMAGVRRAQAIAAKFMSGPESSTDAFLAERRREAERERKKFDD